MTATLPAGIQLDSRGYGIVTEEGTTQLALDLAIAMALDDAACARYLAIYGREWAPCSGERSVAPTTFVGTVR